MARSLLKISNEEIFESSLNFIFRQLDIYMEVQKRTEKQAKASQNRRNNKSNNTFSEESRLKVLD